MRIVGIGALVLLTAAPFSSPQEAAPPAEGGLGEAYYYFCLGRMYEMQMQAETAITNYEQSSRLDPKAAYPHIALAGLYQKTRQVDKAIESARKAVSLDPKAAAAHRILANLYFALLRGGGSPDLAPVAIQEFRATVRLEPNDVESRAQLARLLLANRDSAAAAVELEEVVRLEPDAYYEMYLLAQIRQGQGKRAEAIGLLKQSLAVEPRQPEARDMLAALLQGEERFAELAEIYEDALRDDPQDVEARVRYADALANSAKLTEAAAEFEAALEGDPENVIAMVGLAMVRRELKELDAAEALLERVLRSQPDHVLARFTLASIYEERRELLEAIEAWKKLLALPAEGEEAKRRGAEYWAHLGFDYGELDRHGEAVAAFARARELASGDERYEAFYIQSLLAADRPSDARGALEQALEKQPESDRLRLLEPRVLEANGESKQAIEKALSLAAAEPDNEMWIGGVVDVYQSQKLYGEAESFLKEKLRRSPDNVEMIFQLGAMLERQKKYDGAEVQFRKVLSLQPDNAAALNYLGYMMAERGDRLEESLDLVKRALAQDPHNGAYLDSLGWVYFKMGRLDLAEENLLKAVQNLRLTGVVFDHLGDLYSRKGNVERALSYWRKALDQDDDELERELVARKIEEATSPR
jgi:tetratricopeptide (TPR) repeat protein